MEIFKRIRGIKKMGSLFPEDYTDIHSHLLPGLDDGAADIEATTELIRKISKIGINRFVFTPHVMKGVWNNTTGDIQRSLEEVRSTLTPHEWNGLEFRAAAEYMLDEGFSDLLSERDLLPVAGNFILVEMSFMAPPFNLHEILAKIQIAGYRPILAHPERYFYLHGDMDEYERLKAAGCYFQLNLLSLSTWYGSEVKKMAVSLLDRGWYDFMGSDIHHLQHVDKLIDLTTRKGFWKKINPLLDTHRQWMEGDFNF